MKIKYTFKLLVGLLCLKSFGQVSTKIRLNQEGFFGLGPKMAAIVGSTATSFTIKSPDRSITYYTGNLGSAQQWTQSGETVKVADFSTFTNPGNYVVEVADVGYSYTFKIGNDAFVNVNKAAIKAFYYNRASTALLPMHAGKWARNEGHPDDMVYILPSSASTLRPAGTVLSSPKGWYDAGDYNCYIVNSGISTYTLMLAYVQNQAYYDTLNLNIPESGDNVPDLLDEIRWNLDWMLTMQDPNDGGVYFKKTDAAFDAFEMPEMDDVARYMCKKSSSSTFDFAAVMAFAARIYGKYDATFANNCLNAAKAAYVWGVANPNVTFSNPAAANGYPAVSTGGYGDNTLSDEFEWAANELYISTLDESYYTKGFLNSNTYNLPSWANVRTLGLLSLAHNRKKLTAKGFADTTNIKNKVISMANNYSNYQKNTSPYRIVMGQGGNADFVWGSNSLAANQGMILLNAYYLTQNIDFLNAALSNVDYLLGRNATNYCFVTGLGDNPVMNIHHRPSGADGIVDPVPGWLSGGPSTSSGDGCANSTSTPAISFTDGEECYTKNEIAINWNAPMVYITSATNAYRILNDNSITAINEQFSSGAAQMVTTFPNPSSNIVEIQIKDGLPFPIQMELLDLNGKILFKMELTENNTITDFSHFQSGTYIIKLQAPYNEFKIRHVIK